MSTPNPISRPPAAGAPTTQRNSPQAKQQKPPKAAQKQQQPSSTNKAPESQGDDIYYAGKTAETYHTQTRRTQEELTDVAIGIFRRSGFGPNTNSSSSANASASSSSDHQAKRRRVVEVSNDSRTSQPSSSSAPHGSSTNASSIPSSPLILDLGCGSGLSTEYFQKATKVPFLIASDISKDMLEIMKRQEGKSSSKRRLRIRDPVLSDFRQGMCFRSGVFDFCLSISAVQWAWCGSEGGESGDGENAVGEGAQGQEFEREGVDENYNTNAAVVSKNAHANDAIVETPAKSKQSRCDRFFSELRRIGPSNGSLQFYPSRGNPGELQVIQNALERHFNPNLFSSAIVMEYPNREPRRKFNINYQKRNDAKQEKGLEERHSNENADDGHTPWCALCWPHCTSMCRLVYDESQADPHSNSDIHDTQEPSRLKSIKLHEETFRKYMRNYGRLLKLDEMAKESVTDRSAVGVPQNSENLTGQPENAAKQQSAAAKTGNKQNNRGSSKLGGFNIAEQRCQIHEELGDCGLAVVKQIWGTLERRWGEKPRATEGVEINSGVESESPTAAMLMADLSSQEKIDLLHRCPSDKFREPPEEIVQEK